MFELFGKFSLDVRQALFGALGDATRVALTEITSANMAAALLRTREVGEVCRQAGASVPDLLRALEAPPQGEGTYDALQATIAASAKKPPEFTPQNEQRGIGWLPGPGRFTALPLSPEARHVFERCRSVFAAAEDESVTPRQLLRVFLSADPRITEIFAAHGVIADRL